MLIYIFMLTLSGKTFDNWIHVIGDGLFHYPSESAPNLQDIQLTNGAQSSTLWANILHRHIMIHIIAYLLLVDPLTLTRYH